VPSRLALATASLDARNYRAALLYAEQVLALDPKQAEALRIRDEAQANLARFDGAIADARRRLAARDFRGASKALETARAIDAASPSVTEIALAIADQSRPRETQAEPPRRSRAAEEPRDTPARSQAEPQAQMPSARNTPPPAAPRAPEPVPMTSVPSAPGTSVPVTVPEPPPKANPPPSTRQEPRERAAPAGPTPEEDEAGIRRVVATYARAIESKDVRLFRSIWPNLSRDDERRLEDGFRAVTSQRVDLTILSIQRRADDASVVVRRRDTIQAGGRQHTSESQQTLHLARVGRDWTIVAIR
jgi:hypothetical protein